TPSTTPAISRTKTPLSKYASTPHVARVDASILDHLDVEDRTARPLRDIELHFLLSMVPSSLPPTEEDIQRVTTITQQLGLPPLKEKQYFVDFPEGVLPEGTPLGLAGLRDHILLQCEDLYIAPIILPWLRETIRLAYNKAKNEPGNTVGVRAGEAI